MDPAETNIGVPAVDRNQTANQPPVSVTRPPAQVEFDDSNATAHYANFCKLSGLPEELVIDFGLNPQPMVNTEQPVVTVRLVTGWYTAKRLLQVIKESVERHEAGFGVLETDVQKRIRRS